MNEPKDPSQVITELEEELAKWKRVAELGSQLRKAKSELPTNGIELTDLVALEAGVADKLSPRAASHVRSHVRNVLGGIAVLVGIPIAVFGYNVHSEFKDAVAKVESDATRHAATLEGLLTAKMEAETRKSVFAAVQPVVNARLKAENSAAALRELLDKTRSDVAWVTTGVNTIRSELEKAGSLVRLLETVDRVGVKDVAEALVEQMKSDPSLRLPGGVPPDTVVALHNTDRLWTRKDERLTGWYLCDGEDRDNYSIPDLRGYFLRGLGGVDPQNDRVVGSKQEDKVGPISAHQLAGVRSGNDGTAVFPGRGNYDLGANVETRPKNVAINWLIYKGKPN